jgi:hypothetical protein
MVRSKDCGNRAGEIFAPNGGVWMEQTGDPRRHCVIFDSRDVRAIAQRSGRQGDE